MSLRITPLFVSIISLTLTGLPLLADEGNAPTGAVATATVSATNDTATATDAGEKEGMVIDYHEADLQNVVRTLATRAGLNLIMGEEVAGKVTVHLEGVNYEDAVRLIIESKGYVFIKDKGVARVKTKDALDAEPVEIKVVSLNYAKAEDAKKTLDPLLTGRGKIQVDSRSNNLIISDTPSNLAKLLALVTAIDGETAQVMIEAKFVETTKNPHKDLGINWGNTLVNHQLAAGSGDAGSISSGMPAPSTGFQLGKPLKGGGWVPSTAILDAGQARIAFSYLSSDSDSELLANPRVVTTHNGKAKVSIGVQSPIPSFTYSESKGAFTISGFEYRDIGVVLNVTPRINKNNYVTLEVAPEAGSPAGDADFQGVKIPKISNRTVQTTVLIKSGNTLAIGGLMQQDIKDNYTKVPIMGDIPGIGRFFRSKSLDKNKRDLLIFLTPTIIPPDGQTGYEKHINGLPAENLSVNDTWMPGDNAKARSLFKRTGTPQPAPAPAPAPAPKTNFTSK